MIGKYNDVPIRTLNNLGRIRAQVCDITNRDSHMFMLRHTYLVDIVCVLILQVDSTYIYAPESIDILSFTQKSSKPSSEQ